MSNRADGVESDQTARGITATMTYNSMAEIYSKDSTMRILLCDIGYTVSQCLAVNSEQWHVFRTA